MEIVFGPLSSFWSWKMTCYSPLHLYTQFLASGTLESPFDGWLLFSTLLEFPSQVFQAGLKFVTWAMAQPRTPVSTSSESEWQKRNTTPGLCRSRVQTQALYNRWASSNHVAVYFTSAFANIFFSLWYQSIPLPMQSCTSLYSVQQDTLLFSVFSLYLILFYTLC